MGALMRLIRLARKSTLAALLSILLVMAFCLPVWGAGTCDNFVQNGGFEDEGAFPWEQTTTNNAYEIICGSECDGTNHAIIGDKWAWFGGIDLELPDNAYPDVAKIEQLITIPVETVDPILHFYLYLFNLPGESTSESDFLRVAIGDTEIFKVFYSNSEYKNGYKAVTLNLTGFADNKSHLLRFESSINKNSLSGFFVDDISRPKFLKRVNLDTFGNNQLQPLIDKTLLAQEIRGQDYDSREDIVVNLDNSAAVLTLKGGFGCDFAEIIPGAKTTIRSLEIRSGKVIAQNLVLK